MFYNGYDTWQIFCSLIVHFCVSSEFCCHNLVFSAPVTEDGPVPLTEEEKAAKAAAVQAKIAERRKIAEEKDKEEAVMREKIRLVLTKKCC